MRPTVRPTRASSMLCSLPMVAMLLWMFFAGGGVACVGQSPERRHGMADFLAASGRFFFRSFRCWLVFALLLVVWTWGTLGVVAPTLQSDHLTGSFEPWMLGFDIG